MSNALPARFFLIALTLSSVLGADLVAAPKKVTATDIQVPRSAGSGEIKGKVQPSKAGQGVKAEFTKAGYAPAKSAPSSYTMDGSHQDKAYELVNIPVGAPAGSDSLKATGSAGK